MTKEKDGKLEVDLFKMLFEGDKVTKEFELGDHKVVMRLITPSEQRDILLRSEIRSSANFFDRLELGKLPILSRAIVSIDGLGWDARDEVRELKEKNPTWKTSDAIEEILSKNLSAGALDLFYELYTRLEESQKKAIDELKKDLPSFATTGESAEVSATS